MKRAALTWLAVGVAALIAAALAVSLWNGLWSFLPWSAESRAEREAVRADTAEAGESARRIESQGQAEQIQRVETTHRQVIEVIDATAPVIHETRSAPDAHEPLDPERRSRVRDHQQRMCELVPATCPAD
ncbi:MAG: hypothetical protein ACK4FB_09080 [Brevundimonas sp.]|uniref:hypothetical protein n=1 Tax=Brevundimonas sp. TaxID=1871086 RepID=UPI00391BF258